MKDILLFPLVWKAYSRRDQDTSDSMLNEIGIAMNIINPEGFVKIRGELWQAELMDLNMPILKGDVVEVLEINGLKLKVRKKSN